MQNNSWLFNIKPILLPICLGLLASMPFWVWGVPSGNGDFFNYSRTTYGFTEALRQGEVYPSWISNSNDGYGDPTSRFYPPGLYIFHALIHYVVNDWHYSYLLVFTSLNVIGSLGMFLWAYGLTGNRNAALLGSMALLLAPGHINAFYNISMFAQYAAISFATFLFFFIERIFRRNDLRDACAAAIFLAIIVYFHLPTAIYSAIVVPIYCLLLWLKKPEVRTLGSLTLTATLGAALSSPYWVMMSSELKWIKSKGTGVWFDYRNHFLFEISQDIDFNWWFQCLAIMSLMLLIPTLVLVFKKYEPSWRFFILCGVSLLMATSISSPVWSRLSILQQTQFPWRWLSYLALFTAVLLALTYKPLVQIWQSEHRHYASLLFGAILIPFSFTIFITIKETAYFQHDETNTKAQYSIHGTANEVFRPIWMSDAPDAKLNDMNTLVLTTRPVETTEWHATEKTFRVGQGDQEQARIKLLYYPHWEATTEKGEMLETLPDAEGALLVRLPIKAATVSVRFIEPWYLKIAGWVSIFGFIATLTVIVLKRPSISPLDSKLS